MTVKKLFGKLHLWFGLISGLIVFVVCLTAAIWAFSPEIQNLTQPYRHAKPEEGATMLPLTSLKAIAEKQLPAKKLNRIIFEGKGKAAVADFYGEGYYTSVFINQYTGKVLKIKNSYRDFFTIVLVGHYSLWLGEVGGDIVKWATLIFLIMLITGIVLWWPRNKAARKQRFKIKMGTSPKRLNYDLHNVLGFYASWILVFAAFTGIVWTFTSVANAEWWLASGGEQIAAYPNPVALKKAGDVLPANGIDGLYAQKLNEYPIVYGTSVSFPVDDSSAYNISIYPHKRYYDSDDFYYNQYTLQEMPVEAYGKYADANGGEKLSRMNYDIHIGNILGLPGRIAMFFSVLIGASLPVTGFYIWLGRKKKKPAKAKTPQKIKAMPTAG